MGLLPHGRLGLALRNHPSPCLNGKNLVTLSSDARAVACFAGVDYQIGVHAAKKRLVSVTVEGSTLVREEREI